MEENKKSIINIKMQKTADALRKNNFDAYIAENGDEAVKIILSLISEGESIGLGGSVTLSELGIIDILRNQKYNLLDRYAKGIPSEQIGEILRQSLLSDVFLTSTNAVTENGELYNVDGRANRVAAMLFGPKSVIVVVGYNKIVKDLKAAEERVKYIAAPMNCTRLERNTPCRLLGSCVDCNSKDRICADKVIMSRQMVKGRVKVILVAEELGY